MCGINGIISKEPIHNIEDRIEKMNLSIYHRGPDAGGKHIIQNRYALGHRRLSIIDLDHRSNQPMVSNSGRYIVVYNGEIFNFNDIQKELTYDFKTTSDTEVILAALDTKNLEWLIKRANGMFAFAVFDVEKQELAIVRDRFGIKPLFYFQNKEYLVFSSEIKGILSSGLVDAKLKEESIDEYLGNRYVREPFTFFENINQVRSSHYIKFDKHLNATEKKYWELPRLNFSENFNEKEIIKETDKQVKEAINRWLISDVKVGAYLSGGVDSSLTTAIIAQTTNKVDTYTIGFKDEGYNEFKYAQLVADKYKTQHREFLLNIDNYISEWERLIWYKDSPLGVPNEIPLAIMSTNLSADITVVISGEGADELFGGYGRIFRLPFDFKNTSEKQSNFYKELIGHYEYVPRTIRDSFLTCKINREYFDGIIQKEFSNYSNEENIFRFFHQYHIKGLLQRVDMTTMQTSVEARPPFMDHQLVEFVYKNVPYALKLKWKDEASMQKAKTLKACQYSEVLDSPKYVLKEVARKYLPDEIINRKKMGFPVPLTNWFPNLIELAEKYLLNADWVKKDKINDLINDVKQEQRSGQLLWMFINIEMFKQKYFNKNWRW